jgi:hypothetical protein
VAAVIAITIAVASFVVSALTYWIEQRRVRPIVICHEDRRRHIADRATRSFWVASVHLTNESSTSAFNIRFGVDMAGNHMAWKHSPDDNEASRLNVLRPNEREPEGDVVSPVYIDDRVTWAISEALGGEGDVDDGRKYWAYYQGPAGDWWYTSNPFNRSDDLDIRRVRSRRFGPVSRGNKQLLSSIERGLAIRTQSIRDLNAAAAEQLVRRAEDQAAQEAADDDEAMPDA